jgi:hypothetical protein
MNKFLPLILNCFLLLVIFPRKANSANRYSVASGNWNASTTWSATSGGAPGASVPVNGDAVFIERNYIVTVDISNAACTSIIVGVKNRNPGTLQFNSGSVLTVSGDIILGEDKGTGNPTGSLIMTNGGLLKVGGAFTSVNQGTWTPGTGTCILRAARWC